MNLKAQFNNALKEIKQKEQYYEEKISQGSLDIQDHIDGAYYSGLHNGFNFVWYVLDNNLTQEEFDELLDDLLKNETIN